MSQALGRLTAALADRYRIEREFGAGGMATVYLAQDLKHDRKVALKVLKPELAAVLGAERFVVEIKTTAALQHPHILPLFDSGSADGFLYYVMPFIDGESLRDKLTRERQLDLAECLDITRQVGSALAYAHERGIVHRDIKPENILLSAGHAVVADFGIARAVGAAGGEQLTAIGTAIGTPAYMSPEQSAGESNLDGRSDQYALASVLYELLAGEPPFTGRTAAAVIAKRLGTTAPSARVLRDSVPRAVDRALQRALQRAPADRFATTSEFAAALGAGSGTPASRVSRAGGIAVIAVLTIAAAGWLGLRGGRGDTGLDADVIAVLPFRVGGDPAIGYLRESMLDLLQARLSTGTGPRTVEPRTLLAAWRRAAGNEQNDLSAEASRDLARELGAGRVLLGSAIATPTELTLSATLVQVGDGAELARESVVGAPDSIAVLVNRLTAALLIRDAGEARERQTGLAAAPLDALQDYLAGRKAYRRGDYFGAMDLYGRAFARDSTFVDAAFGLVATNAWIGTVFTVAGFEAIPHVWRMRERLGARDFGLFLAMPLVGPGYPKGSTYAEIIAQGERAANEAPDSPEHWLLLGQLFTSYGAAASQPDWRRRGAEALDRAISLDSSFTVAVGAGLFAALNEHDAPAVTRLGDLLETRVAAGFGDDFLLWAAARARGDSVGALRWRDRTAGLSRTDYMQKLVKTALFGVQFGLPLADSRWAVATLRREAATEAERGAAQLSALAVQFAEGTVELGAVSAPYGPGWASTLIQQALIVPAYRSIAAAVAAEEAGGGYRLATSGGEVRWPPVQLCYGQLLRVAGGDTSGTAAAIRGLRAFEAQDPPPIPAETWQRLETRLCPLLLQVLLEPVPSNTATRWARLDALDSIMQRAPATSVGYVGGSPGAFANFTIARLREAQGNLPAALAAIRRRETDGYPAYLWSRLAFLRQEGRLAALAGDTAGALRAYDAYLTQRSDPDPPLRPERDSVIAERAALARSTGR